MPEYGMHQHATRVKMWKTHRTTRIFFWLIEDVLGIHLSSVSNDEFLSILRHLGFCLSSTSNRVFLS